MIDAAGILGLWVFAAACILSERVSEGFVGHLFSARPLQQHIT